MLNLPELKVLQPSDTRWLTHERCVKAVKSIYPVIVLTLDHIYEETHEPEALGIYKALCKANTIEAVYLLENVLPLVANLSKALQAKNLDFSAISCLVNATLLTIDECVQPSAKWILDLQDLSSNLEAAIGTVITESSISTFLNTVAEPLICDLRDNIVSRFVSSANVVSAFCLFNPIKFTNIESTELCSYGKDPVEVLLAHYGTEKPAEILSGEYCTCEAIISSDVHSEWTTYKNFLAISRKDDTTSQLKELVTNDTLRALCPNLSKLGEICLPLPLSTASVEGSFSQMKLIKTRLRNQLSVDNLSDIMKIAIESPNDTK